MGNCCSHKSGSPRKHSKEHYNNIYAPARPVGSDAYYVVNGDHGMLKQPMSSSRNSGIYDRQTSSSNLQHISEREPEDGDCDPSVNARTETIFIQRSDSKHKNHRRRRSEYEHRHHIRDYGRLTRKYNSCSTIFIDNSTVSQPNLKNSIRAVALAIYFHIKNRDSRTREGLPPSLLAARYAGDPQAAALTGVDLDDVALLEVFDEKLHPLTKEPVPEDYYRRDPEHKTIYRFIRNLFHSAQLTAECAIVTLVYLERLLTYGDMGIAPYNWKRIVLGAILLASKVWDDQAVWNVDYCQILKDISVEDMNELERQFLETLQFNINVPSSVYAKYYFDLRALADAHDLSFPSEVLNKDRAVKLEAMSSSCEDKLRLNHTLRRAQSLDGLTGNPRNSKAILS